MDAEQFEKFVSSQKWTFAKSMPRTPHEYIVKGRGNTPEEFEAAVTLLREAGYWHSFYRLRNQYLDLGEHFYWTMGAPIPETTILNRALFSDYPKRVRSD
jgi:hypothetical protein